jgi:hypothetical protein
MRKRFALLALLGMTLPACHNMHFVTKATPGEVHREWSHYFIAGLVGNAVYDVRRVCPQGVSSIHQGSTFVDMLLTGLTGSLWSPRTVTITCAAGGATANLPAKVMLAFDGQDRVIMAAVEDALGKTELHTMKTIAEVQR